MKYTRTIPFWVIFSIFIFIIFSCQSDYTKMVNKEARQGELKNDLVFGLVLGSTKKDFFNRCWELNKEGLVTQGPNNNSVQHVLGTENLTAINMLFYGVFDAKDKMTGMNFEFSYKAWSLWNKKYEARELLPVMKDTLMKWFPGNEFIPLKIDRIEESTLVKVDGNRQIMVYVKDDKDVAVKIEDLSLKYPDKYN